MLGKLDDDIRRMKLDHFLTPHPKTNSKWMKDLNVRQETIQILEENTRSNLFDLGCSNFLLDMSPEAKETSKHELSGLLQDKVSAQQRKQSTKLKGSLQNGRRYLQMTYLIKGSYPKS